MNMKKIEYHSLYVLKALAALFVLMIHLEFYKRQYLEPIFKCGVPVFYIISGFFLYSANPYQNEERNIRKGMTKIFKIMLFFNLAYFILQYAESLFRNRAIKCATSTIDFTTGCSFRAISDILRIP